MAHVKNLTETTVLSLATIIGGTAIVLGGKGLWKVGEKTVNVAKWGYNNGLSPIQKGVLTAWETIQWGIVSCFDMSKHAFYNIPTAGKWGLSKGQDLAHWTISAIKDSSTTFHNGCSNVSSLLTYGADRISNVASDLFDLMLKHTEEIAHTINETFPITGQMASKMELLAKKALHYNPMPWVFKKAPSLINPSYAALGAVAASVISDPITRICGEETYIRERQNLRLYSKVQQEDPEISLVTKRSLNTKALIELFVISIGTSLTAPRIANYFSSHVITRTQALGWGCLFGAAKAANTNIYEKPLTNKPVGRE